MWRMWSGRCGCSRWLALCDSVLGVLMRCRRGSTRGCAPSNDLEQGFRRSRVADRWTNGVVKRVLLPPLWLILLF